VPFFKRDFQKLDFNKKQFAEARKLQSLLENKEAILRKNALLISTLAMLNNPLGLKIKQFFRDITLLADSNDVALRPIADDLLYHNPTLRQKTLTLLQAADMNVSNLQIISKTKANGTSVLTDRSDEKRSKQVKTFHKKFDAQLNPVLEEMAFDLDEDESEGTRKFYTVIPFLLRALETGFPILLDELEAQLHPKLTKQIIEIFNNSTTNPKNTQLLAVTHDTHLLSASLLRRDQILFVEKDKYGASRLYSLVEFKGVRNDASFENDYLMGRYGAVPFLNHLMPIFEP
jgi:AAA15 family ATPase/GTPase